jgi:hypothetical protein
MSFVTLGSSSVVALFTIWLFSQWRPR